jgi:tyrosinase
MMTVGSTLRGLYALLTVVWLLSVLVSADAVGDLQTKGRAAVDAAIAKSTTCTKDKVKVRREWYVFRKDLFAEKQYSQHLQGRRHYCG